MRRVLMFAAAVAAAAPAQAHWQYTRWGMSPAEVRQANPGLSAGEDRGNSIEGSLVRLAGPYVEAGRNFTARFGFDDGDRLNTVYLQAADPRDCPGLIEALEAAHGPGARGTSTEVLETRSWRDAAGGNFIHVFMIGWPGEPVDCQLRYHPPEGPPAPTGDSK